MKVQWGVGRKFHREATPLDAATFMPDRYQPRQPTEDGPAEPPIKLQKLPPVRVLAAMNYVAHCNEHFGLRNYVSEKGYGEVDAQIIDREISHDQHPSFRAACHVLESYFNDYIARKQRHGRTARPFAW